jgi:3-oxoacyl-[acyl-carrier protein] reductase
VVFAAGGSAGAAIAREFAAQGAEVFLSSRALPTVEVVAKEITEAGGRANAAVVDALDETAVDGYLDQIVQDTGHVDVVFNAIGPRPSDYGIGKPAAALTVEEFMTPLTGIVRSQFVTARAAARHMTRQRSGVIMLLTGSPARPHGEGAYAIGAAFGAIENLTRHLAIELGPSDVRVVCLRTAAMPDDPRHHEQDGQPVQPHRGRSGPTDGEPDNPESVPAYLGYR